MKKRLLPILISLLLLVLFTAGCSSRSTLSLNTAFYGDGNEPTPGYKETLTYDVTCDENGVFKRQALVREDFVKYTFSGTYTTTLEVLSAYKPEHNIESDIKREGTECIYFLTTKLVIDAKYDFNNDSKDFDHKDEITTECYLLPSTKSYAPIYSKTTACYARLHLNSAKSNCSIVEYERIANYNTASYLTKTRACEYYVDETKKPILSEINPTEQTVKYTLKTAVDNAELLFVLRNVKIDVEKTYALPVSSIGYNDLTDLTVTNVKEFKEKHAFTLNGNDVEEEITLKQYSFVTSSSKNAGTKQFVYIQKKENNQLPYKSYMVKYEQPLMSAVSGNASSILGTLIYTLTDVNFN